MKKHYLLLALFLLGGCASEPLAINADTQTPQWQPHLSISQSLLPRATDAQIVFENPNLNLNLQPTNSGEWQSGLSESVLKSLLAGQVRREVPGHLIFHVTDGKGHSHKLSQEIKIIFQKTNSPTVEAAAL